MPTPIPLQTINGAWCNWYIDIGTAMSFVDLVGDRNNPVVMYNLPYTPSLQYAYYWVQWMEFNQSMQLVDLGSLRVHAFPYIYPTLSQFPAQSTGESTTVFWPRGTVFPYGKTAPITKFN